MVPANDEQSSAAPLPLEAKVAELTAELEQLWAEVAALQAEVRVLRNAEPGASVFGRAPGRPLIR